MIFYCEPRQFLLNCQRYFRTGVYINMLNVAIRQFFNELVFEDVPWQKDKSFRNIKTHDCHSIDELVYGLYNLTEEEIAILEEE